MGQDLFSKNIIPEKNCLIDLNFNGNKEEYKSFVAELNRMMKKKLWTDKNFRPNRWSYTYFNKDGHVEHSEQLESGYLIKITPRIFVEIGDVSGIFCEIRYVSPRGTVLKDWFTVGKDEFINKIFGKKFVG